MTSQTFERKLTAILSADVAGYSRLMGEELKVDHVLEGSVRKAGNKLRISAQLIKLASRHPCVGANLC